MGNSIATVEQMQSYIKKVNPNVIQSVVDMIPLYLSEGLVEGVRGDIAFAQSCLETGNFTFKGSAVSLDQNNFAGIGVVSRGMKGNSWSTAQLGIRAQIQHLKAYAIDLPLNQDCVDDRYKWVAKGCAPYVEWLGIQENPNHKGWAAGSAYGTKILNILNRILDEPKNKDKNDINIKGVDNVSIMNGIAGRRGKNPVGAFIHNDAAGNGATANHYKGWLPTHNALNGFAHYYVCSDGILQAEDDSNIAWHCGQADGNANYLSFEFCQSMGDLSTFKSNEEKGLQLIAQKFKQYGIVPNSNTVKLHQEVFATACPHRSVEIHGGLYATKQYFINKIKLYMSIGESGWVKDNIGWWYRYANGGYAKSGWEFISGSWYYFNEKGYALSSQWIKYKDNWYYLRDNCKMATGWLSYENNWYYLNDSGTMQTGWILYNNKWYYLNPKQKTNIPEGAMITGIFEIKGVLYNFLKSGEMEWEINLNGGILKAIADKKWAIEYLEEHLEKNDKQDD